MQERRTTNMCKCQSMKVLCILSGCPAGARKWHISYFVMLLHSKSSQGVSCVLATVSVFHLLPQETGGRLDQPLVCLLKGAVVFPQKQQYAAHKVALG